MTNFTEITPMLRTIYFLVYPGFESLDVAGPTAVFQMANQLAQNTAVTAPAPRQVLKRRGDSTNPSFKQPQAVALKPLRYRIALLSLTGGLVATNAGWQCETTALAQVRLNKRSTLLVSGAEAQAVLQARQCQPLIDWLTQQAKRSERYGSICSGAFLLAAAGLLANKHCTTHWEARAMLAKISADALLERDQLYVQDGSLWTSAGGASGVDMALAMVAADYTRELANTIAKRLVVYAVRPGNQSQFAELSTPSPSTSRSFAELVQWLDANLHQELSVQVLSARVQMSVRSFQRKFKLEFDQTPARFVEARRMHRAKILLQTALPIKTIAKQLGFASESGFRSAFAAFHQLPPGLQRSLHRA